jgi:hypothetical protein
MGQAIEYVLGQTETDVLIGVSSASEVESMFSLGPVPGTGQKAK